MRVISLIQNLLEGSMRDPQKAAKEVIQKAYKNINPTYLSKSTRSALNLTDEAFTYGEIDTQSLINLLEMAQPQVDDIFYDLGSGAGRAAITAALCFNLKQVVGIEYLKPLYQLSEERWGLIQSESNFPSSYTTNLSFWNADYFDVDLSSANIIFFNATASRGEHWERMAERFYTLPTGCRLILTSHQLPLEKGFLLLYEGLQLMSWGMNSVYIYKKI